MKFLMSNGTTFRIVARCPYSEIGPGDFFSMPSEPCRVCRKSEAPRKTVVDDDPSVRKLDMLLRHVEVVWLVKA